ncbi:septum formation protein Maf [Phenylobacterium sp. Root77]|jgi:septum formation protein|uniref:Maf family protein n=1 Tax=unclassified Phenylobacterium TaxID=2640670 RepID=UPI0006F28410|nr:MULTISPECIES: nucleoside triphosphate pyrophosphatase [unclassified Phenylobacterium]KQW69137.1 septum formation protein Maf [Phenylobacterium sp. Root1277]KQW95497.1 septum formation protein Maf [Phenylobacterium sp. Root1290]KRC41287.1 septum formation protein Maf [Phenylobacterium sp. Root77]
MSELIILASKSAARRAVLTGAGVPFEVAVAGVDEDAVKTSMLAQGASPRDVADALAEIKAVKISAGRPGFVIGSDQTLEFEGKLYDKAETLEAAAERLKTMRGKPHKLHSAVVVAKDGAPIWREIVSATLTMRDFSDAFLAEYLEAEGAEMLGSVGCYRLEGPGAQLFSKIEGDYFTILGLPLMGLLDLFRRHGVLTA